MRIFGWVLGAGTALVAACSNSTVAQSSSPGTAGAPCYPNGTCNDGLTCTDDLCFPSLNIGGGPNGSGGRRSGDGGAASGGRPGTGGLTASGGALASGGSGGTAGESSTGGDSSSGGSADAGGASAAGGQSSTGGGVGAGGATSAGGATGDGGSGTGGTADAGPPPTECETYSFRARADSANSPFVVPPASREIYQCFDYHVDTKGAAQVFSVLPVVPDQGGGVIHHILLYKVTSAVTNGATSPCLGYHADGVLIAVWIPGVGAWNLPSDVGIELDSNDFLMEVHFDNPADTSYSTSAGIDLCLGSGKPHTATVSWLGNDVFGGFGVAGIPPNTTSAPITGYCAPTLGSPAHIVMSLPFMRKLGRHLRARVDHPGGSATTFLDVPFSYGYGTTYAIPAVVNPGDFVTTTCTFDNTTASTVNFGEATTNEVCFDYTVAYPPRALVGGGLHNDSCITATPP